MTLRADATAATEMFSLQSQDEALPDITGRYLHFDASTISAIDQTRLAAWSEKVHGLEAYQGDGAHQPLYRRSGINGRPSVEFNNGRNDSLGVSGVTMGLAGTVAMVVTNAPASGNRYLFGTDGTQKNVYWSATDNVGMQSTSLMIAPSFPNTPKIIIAQFGSSGASALRVDGVRTAGDTGVPSSAPTRVRIGHRDSLVTGQGHDGMIGELIYYDRSLPTGECEALERYLSAKWDIPVMEQTHWYVDTVFGSDANTGRSTDSAVASVERAWRGMEARQERNAVFHIHAPEHAPSRLSPGTVLEKADGGSVRMQSLVAGGRWHLHGMTRVDSGWTPVGNGVFSRPLTAPGVSAPYAFVVTMLDAAGNPVRVMTRNTSTPNSPSEGQFGFSGGTYYLHLPAGENPNNHTIDISTSPGVIRAHSGSTIMIERGVLRGGQNQTVLSGTGAAGQEGGFVSGVDTIAEGGLIGAWVTAGNTDGMTCVRCVGRYSANDGFNHHASPGNRALMDLTDCKGAFNADEGVSPHDDTILILRGGRFHHNGSGGITSVGNAVTYLYDTEVDHNRTIYSGSGWDVGGISILEQSRLVSLNLYSHDHPGPGVEVETSAGATWTDNGGTRSGTAHGNGAPDMT